MKKKKLNLTKVQLALIIIASVLLLVLLVGGLMQLCSPVDSKAKPSNWFRKEYDLATLIAKYPDEVIKVDDRIIEFRGVLYLYYYDENEEVRYIRATKKQADYSIYLTSCNSDGIYIYTFSPEDSHKFALCQNQYIICNYTGAYQDMIVFDTPIMLKVTHPEVFFESSMTGYTNTGFAECDVGIVFDFNVPNARLIAFSMGACKMSFTIYYYELEEMPEDFDLLDALGLTLPEAEESDDVE